MAEQVPDAVADIRAAVRRDGLDRPVVERLETRLVERAKECGKALLTAQKDHGPK